MQFTTELLDSGETRFVFTFHNGEKWRQMTVPIGSIECGNGDDFWDTAAKAFDLCRQVARQEISTEAA